VGSFKSFKSKRYRGKVDSLLNQQLDEVKWGEFKLGDLFEKIKIKSLKYKTSELPSEAKDNFTLPALTAGIQNQGLNNFVPKEKATILKNVISISANGANTGSTFYQSKDFTILQDAYAINWIYSDRKLSHNQYRYLTTCISKTIFQHYEWTNKAGWQKIKNDFISLPTKNNQPDFDFMESFIFQIENERIHKLQNYLEITGLQNYNLTEKEKEVLKAFENDEVEWKTFNLEKLFGKATRGKRLKSSDRIIGNIPFVTAGENNEGISAFIGNDINIFSENTTTIDMFGSAKYRNYKYGGDDHISVISTQYLPKLASVFVTSAIHKSSHTGDFHYGNNFYPKDADNLSISLPIKNNQPNFEMMETLISAIQKQIIKDVVLYVDDKLSDEV